MARIGHKKSRNGCSRCKQRKVKCDEKRPCSACIKQEVECSLTQSPDVDNTSVGRDHPSKESRVGRPKRDKPATGIGILGLKISSIGVNRSPSKPVAGYKFQQPFGWTVDLGLMSHYSCYTAATLPGASRHTWQYEVPREAVTYPFLMHQILAVSAFHLASLEPSQHQTHLTQALQHQQNTISGIQTEISHVSSENCHALFAASSMLFIGAFAASASATDISRPAKLNDILDIFTLVRGVSGILKSSKEMVRQGVLGDFMQCDLPAGQSALLRLLVDEKLPLITNSPNWDDVNPEAKVLAEQAITSLRESVGVSSAALPELNVAVCWPMTLQDGFMALLRVYHPAALVVLAHYCVVLHAAGWNYWFMRGWGSRLIATITKSLVPAWHDSIRWPIEYVKASGIITAERAFQSSRAPRPD